MKLLGWMHRRFGQNGNEPLKDLVIEQKSIDDQQFYPKSNYGMKPFKQAQRDQHNRKSFTSIEAARIEEGDYVEESSAISELFHGFLAIGTLGAEQVIDDPSTPRFSISIDNITEKNTEATENELKVINEELEKVLGAEAKDNGCCDSSRRNSHVSNGRSSHGSVITLSGKPLEGPDSNGNGNGTAVCPLQEYLFGSAIELSETTKTAKKEHRTSLGELFQKSKLTDENAGERIEREEMQAEKETDKSAMRLMKKVLKKRMIYASSRNNGLAAGGTPVDTTSAETKLNKILHKFQRKVHPEKSSAPHKSKEDKMKDNKKKITHDDSWNSRDQVLQEEDIIMCPQRALPKQSKGCRKSESILPQFMFSSIDSNGNKEHWIKTDADYLVLEL